MFSSSTWSHGKYCNCGGVCIFFLRAVPFSAKFFRARDELFFFAFFFVFIGSKPLVSATVHQNCLPGHVRCALGRKPHDCIRHLSWLPHALQCRFACPRAKDLVFSFSLRRRTRTRQLFQAIGRSISR